MKASKLSVLLFLAAGLVSCGGDTMVMNTEIHPDGTCCRELSFITDTSGVSGYVVVDTAYCTSVQRQWNDRRDSCLVRLAYRYPSVGRMSEHLPFRVAGQPLARWRSGSAGSIPTIRSPSAMRRWRFRSPCRSPMP